MPEPNVRAEEMRDEWAAIKDNVADVSTATKQDTIIAELEAIEGKDFATSDKQDTAIAGLGALHTNQGETTDAEATTDGTIIAILKRIRTLIGQSVKTIGSAIGTTGQLMLGSDGTNARALKTTSDGTQVVEVSGSIVKEETWVSSLTVTAGSGVFLSTFLSVTNCEFFTIGINSNKSGFTFGIGAMPASSSTAFSGADSAANRIMDVSGSRDMSTRQNVRSERIAGYFRNTNVEDCSVTIRLIRIRPGGAL